MPMTLEQRFRLLTGKPHKDPYMTIPTLQSIDRATFGCGSRQYTARVVTTEIERRSSLEGPPVTRIVMEVIGELSVAEPDMTKTEIKGEWPAVYCTGSSRPMVPCVLRSMTVVGQWFIDERMTKPSVGARVLFEAVTDNPHDAFAVKVLCNGRHVGWVPRQMSPLFHTLVRRGEQFYGIVQSHNDKQCLPPQKSDLNFQVDVFIGKPVSRRAKAKAAPTKRKVVKATKRRSR